MDQHKKPDFNEIYKQLQAPITNYIRSRVYSKEDAEDISAEVFEKVYKNLPDFKWQGVSVKSWVYRIAKNTVIDYYRKNDKYKKRLDYEKISKSVSSDEQDILVALLETEERRKLYIAISELKEQDQYLIYYKYFEELSIAEIAKRLNLSETNIGTKLHRLRNKLTEIIKSVDKNAEKTEK
jgi:RNA polymerase sigma-70 factor (ECF subfamily)